ncbi:MAG: hypothetical protein JJE37_11310 [Methyloceanibacter sp.]|nr:hypothetical protein [Methyloceanibacter sp.]
MSADDLLLTENAGQLHDPAFARFANARYRRDIGQRLIEGDFAKVEALGLLDL